MSQKNRFIKKILLIFYLTVLTLVLFTGTVYAAAPTKPISDVSPWWYNAPQTVSLTVDPINAASTYYTLDNNSPTQASTPYTGPITISATGPNQTVTLRAVSYDASNVRGTELVVTLIFDTIAPQVVNVNSIDSRHIAITYDSDVNNADITGNYAISGGLHIIDAVVQSYGVVELTVDQDLSEGTSYDLTINNVSDTAGNIINSAQFSFTYDTIRPKLVSASYIDGTTIKLVFSEKVDPGLAEYPLSYTLAGFDVSNAILQADGKSVVLTLNQPLEPGTYTIEALVPDINGNDIDPGNDLATFTVEAPAPAPPSPPSDPTPTPTPVLTPTPTPITLPVNTAPKKTVAMPFIGDLIQTGSHGKAVEILQSKLVSLGFDLGMVDGIVGTKTRTAILNYQKANGLVPDGIVGPITWAKLFGIDLANYPGVYNKPLFFGQYNAKIASIQAKLTDLGFNESSNFDGVFGIKTLHAIIAFQKAKGLVVDGIVGKLTWKALFS